MGGGSSHLRQRIEPFVGRAKKCGLCHGDQPAVSLLVEEANDKLFESVLTNPEHTLNKLLPERRNKLIYHVKQKNCTVLFLQ